MKSKQPPDTSTQTLGPVLLQPKVAIVHDWLTNMGGAEPLVLELHKLYPNAPIYTSVFDKEKMPAFAKLDVRTTYLQKVLPKFLRYKHVLWPVLRAHAFRNLDMSQYDLIISSSTAEAKAVKKRADAVHICYCNTPTRYYWSHYEHFKNSFHFGMFNILIKPIIPPFVWWMRKLDLNAAAGVDYFMANSNEVKRRIKKYYNRESTVVWPAVDVERFSRPSTQTLVPKPQSRSGFILWGRHVPYKRFDLAIEACNKLKLPLVIVGTGPQTEELKKIAGPSITFTGRVSDSELATLAQTAEAFLFPGDEDFGIAPVEALAAGTPVIAYKSGGALDYVIEDKTGTLFDDQTVASLVSTLKNFDAKKYKSSELRNFATKFNAERFRNEVKDFISKHST